MIRISQIDSNLSIYKDKIVVIFGSGEGFKEILSLFKHHKIDTEYICDNDKNKWGEISENIPIISPKHLEHIANNKLISNKIVVQIVNKNPPKNVEEQFKLMGINQIISYNEAHKILNIISFINLYKYDPENPYFTYRNKQNNNIDALKKMSLHNMLEKEEDLPVFIVQIQKTGDMTLVETFKKNNIKHYFTSHNPMFFDKELFKDKTIKITTAIREPIAKNMSNLYYNICENGLYESLFKLIKDEKDFFANGGDAQVLFDIILKKNFNAKNYNIPIFMELFKDNIIDLLNHPFDTQKGYTIVKDGNIEVFVYQLERMNDIVKEMSEWIGQTPFDEWVMDNESSSKWIANSYKQAQSQIQFSQEYFDNCYDNPWIKHFYSQEDIEKFKKRWRPHIK